MKKSQETLNKHLAKHFSSSEDKETMLSELFNLLDVNCLIHSNIDHKKLDELITECKESKTVHYQTLSEIFKLIQTGKEKADNVEKEFISNIKNYICEHLTEALSIEEIADALHISYYYMCHLFKKQTNCTISAFRNEKRLEKAVRLLLETKKDVLTIALECGFQSASYFTKQFHKVMNQTPSAFRTANKGKRLLDFYNLQDMQLLSQLGFTNFLDSPKLLDSKKLVKRHTVHMPDSRFGFLHEAAIIEYKNVLYAAWYHNVEKELQGYTPICLKRSFDKGETWTELEIVADDKTEEILYCPPVFAICDDTLYMFMNQMVAADYMHSLDLYKWNSSLERFELVWSRPIPFKLNTNVISLPNGKLMLPGRIGDLDGFPQTPAVLISDSGKVDADWRLVNIAPNGNLVDGSVLIYPEMTVIDCENTLFAFCRNDERNVPLVYLSKDCGETWSEALAHDIPYVSSKIYAGTLKNGKNYLIANTDNVKRSKLSVYFSERGKMQFDKELVLFDIKNKEIPDAIACHYPAAVETEDTLYVITTISYNDMAFRGATLFAIDIRDI